MAAGNLAVNLVTPKGVVAHTDADSVTAPGELGEFELLPGHVPMLTALRPGVLVIGSAGRSSSAVPAGGARRYAVSSGYLRVDPAGAVEILVEQAVSAKDIDVEVAKNELKTSEAELAKWGDKAQDGEYTNLSQRAGWARARIDAASH